MIQIGDIVKPNNLCDYHDLYRMVGEGKKVVKLSVVKKGTKSGIPMGVAEMAKRRDIKVLWYEGSKTPYPVSWFSKQSKPKLKGVSRIHPLGKPSIMNT